MSFRLQIISPNIGIKFPICKLPNVGSNPAYTPFTLILECLKVRKVRKEKL
jgi:hypothetical protein